MAIDAEIEAAVVAMRAVRVKGAKVHEEVMRAYARAAVEAAERARKEDFQDVLSSTTNRQRRPQKGRALKMRRTGLAAS
jgi:hypothetical protein